MTQLELPRPGKALTGLMIALTAVWLMFAVGLNWGGAPGSLFIALTGNTSDVLHGQVWRLLTAPLLQAPSSAWHLLSALLGLYFLGSRLEATWGGARFLRFVAFTSVGAYVLQMLAELALPSSLGARLVGTNWFGIMPAVTAISMAWAFSFRGEKILLILFPVSSNMLIAAVVGMALLHVAAGEMPAEGMLSPFGGMFLGWLLGGGSPTPLRKAWLRFRLAQLDTEARRDGARRKARRNPGGLRVIPGGRADDDDDGKGPDGRYLN